MELADIGGQPKKLAYEVHRQLRTQFSSVPLPVPLDEIAGALGIVEIVEHETDAFEGTLIVKGEKGAVALRKGMTNGRRRFTLGHEIGHFANPFHRLARSDFQCTAVDMRRKRKANLEWEDRPAWDRMEIEANEFSNALLLPGPEYRVARSALGSDIDVEHIVSLARMFGVSLEVLANTYVHTSRDMLAAILSKDGEVRRVMAPSGFPYLGLKKGVPVPPRSLTRTFPRAHARGTASVLSEVSADTWLDRTTGDQTVYEQVLVLANGHAMTLLYVDEREVDEDEDDSRWNRRNRSH
jgi:hypothetical protein